MNDVKSERERSDLLAYALFESAQSDGYRHPILAFLISVALFELGRAATRQEILKMCREQFLPGEAVNLSEIEAVVSVAMKENLLVNAPDGQVELSEDRRQHLQQASTDVGTLREGFHREIVEAVEEKLGDELSSDRVQELRAVLEGFFQRLFQEESLQLAKGFGEDGVGFDAATARELDLPSLERLARGVTKPVEKLRRAKIAAGIRHGLLHLSPSGQKYLATIYQKIVVFALLQQDPTVRRVRRELIAKRIFYLDTNVVVALLFSADERHAQVRNAVDAALQLGAALVISPFTLEELEQQLMDSNLRYGELKDLTVQFPILNDVILRTYAAELGQNPKLLWTAFFAGFVPISDALEERGIEVVDADAPAARLDDRRQSVREAVAHHKPPYTHEKVIDVDTDNLVLVLVRRETHRADVMGRRVWLITLDHYLKVAEQMLIANGVYEIPAAKHLRTWAVGFSPHLSPDQEDLGSYVLRVVQSQLGLIGQDPIFADVDFLSILEKGPFDLQDLLNSDLDKTRRVLIAIQEEKEIEEVLVHEPSEPAERDEWIERLSAMIRRALSRLEEEPLRHEAIAAVEHERDKTLAEMEALDRRHQESMEEIERLEARIKQGTGGEAGLWDRLRRLFP